ncbi:MAG: chloride channel protein [Bacteroidetes bacterium]|nr:chloride channel protein [Bacteroidota bacterium]
MVTKKIGIWRRRYFGTRTSLMLTSVVIGLLTALCAVVLKNSVHFIQQWVHQISIAENSHYLLFVFPTLGILLTVFYTQVFRNGDLGRGVTNIIFAISRKSSYVEKDKLYSQMLSSILTVGFGGSAGLEAPIAATGSAIGSNTARWLHFNLKERTLLLACGTAAGISAIFNAPIAGVIFAFEILLVNMPMPVIVPLLIASASSALLSKLIYSGQPFVLITNSWSSDHLGYYVLFGFIAALLSVYAIRIYFFIGDLFYGKKQVYLKAIIGGLFLGALIFLFPPLYGEGYDSVLNLLHKESTALISDSAFIPNAGAWTVVVFAIALMLLKVVATSLTVGAGGNGGMFGSSLFTGAMCGYAFSHSVNLLGLAHLDEVNFTVIGMAAMMSGIIHSPLTAIFLIAEITGGYALFVPLMVVVSIAYLVSRYFEPFSVYTKKLALKGDLITTDKDKLVLAKMNLQDYLETDFIPVNENDTLADLIHAIENSKRNIFPVVNEENKLVGEILLDNVRHVMFSKELYDKTFIKDLMITPAAIVDVNDSMEKVLKLFDETNLWNLPVTDKGKYVGFVSKSKIFTQYRHHLIKDAVVPA